MLRRPSHFVLLACAIVFMSLSCSSPPEISASRGQELYMSYGCAACHGADGDGKGPAANLSTIPPRNLRKLTSYVAGTSADEIASSIEFGMKATGMPAYTDLPRDERLSIAMWILSIAEETK